MSNLINGRMYDWASIELGIAGAPIPSFTAVEYSDSQEASFVYGKGKKPAGYRKGNYAAEGKITLHRESFEALQAFFAASGSTMYGRPPFTVTISYAAEGKPVITDVLEDVMFTSRGQAMSQNDEAASVDVDLICSQIRWNKVAP